MTDSDGDRPVTVDEVIDAALAHVAIQHRIEETARSNLALMIEAARGLGATWSDVGRVLGVSRQYAARRYGAGDDEGETRDRRPRPR